MNCVNLIIPPAKDIFKGGRGEVGTYIYILERYGGSTTEIEDFISIFHHCSQLCIVSPLKRNRNRNRECLAMNLKVFFCNTCSIDTNI